MMFKIDKIFKRELMMVTLISCFLQVAIYKHKLDYFKQIKKRERGGETQKERERERG